MMTVDSWLSSFRTEGCMDKITVSPEDDPSAVHAEIEIVATATQGKLRRFLMRVKIHDRSGLLLGSGYVEKCVLVGFQKHGYILWKSSKVETILCDNNGYYWVWGVFARNEV